MVVTIAFLRAVRELSAQILFQLLFVWNLLEELCWLKQVSIKGVKTLPLVAEAAKPHTHGNEWRRTGGYCHNPPMVKHSDFKGTLVAQNGFQGRAREGCRSSPGGMILAWTEEVAGEIREVWMDLRVETEWTGTC